MPSRKQLFWMAPLCLVTLGIGCGLADNSLTSQLARVNRGEQDKIQTEELITDRDLALVRNCSQLRELLIEQSSISDAGIGQLAGLPELEHVRIRGGHVGDDGLKHLSQFKTLRFLNLPQADLSDESLQVLIELPKLELLRFGSPRVTDAGMESVAKLSHLRHLHLIGVPITDAGLDKLHELRSLESLYLDDTKVTDEGLERFLNALPDVHLHINQQHHDRDPHRHSH